MGLFDAFRHKEPEGDLLAGGADGFFDVLDADGRLVRYMPDDFDEIWTTTDAHEAGHHVSIGWLLLDELTEASVADGPGLLERALASGIGEGVGWDRRRSDGGMDLGMRPGHPVSAPAEGPVGESVTTYVLGYLKPGRQGSPQT